VPKGAQLAVLYGDPTKDGPFVVRAKLPANYRIPAHSHPTDEVVTVLGGTLFVGMGDKLAPTSAQAFPAGSLVVAPAKTKHYVLTNQPRPTNGILVAMIVMKSTFASCGKLAM
jgi:quercetin dioxygenase-like cupin family protein